MSNLSTYLKDSLAYANEQFNRMIEREPPSIGRPFWALMTALSLRCTHAEIQKEHYAAAASCVALSIFSVYTLSHLNGRFAMGQRQLQQENFRQIREEFRTIDEGRRRRIQERIAHDQRGEPRGRLAFQNSRNLGG